MIEASLFSIELKRTEDFICFPYGGARTAAATGDMIDELKTRRTRGSTILPGA
jgi:hypothetical protein